MCLPIHQRYEIVFLAKNKFGPEFGTNKIARIMKCNRSTVTRWLKRWKVTKDLNDGERSGRSRITTSCEDEMIVETVESALEKGLDSKAIQMEVSAAGVHVSSRTVRRRWNDDGLKYSRPLLKPLLKEEHREHRSSWARRMCNFSWNYIVSSDETQIRLNYVKRYYW